MDPDLTLLAELVGDIDEFAATRWGQRPLHRPSGKDFRTLLDVPDIERLLATSARRPTFRLVQDGASLPAERSTAPARLGGAVLDDVADLERIAAAVDGGATLVLQSLQRTWLPLAELCRALERATSHPVQANAYLTPAGASGLARHHDEHDVVVLQVSGHKAWKVDGLGALTTRAGDVLYLPARTPHAAEAQDEASLHLTVGLLRVTVGQALRRALDDLDLDLGRPLPLGYARPERAEGLQRELQRTFSAAARSLSSVELAARTGAEQAAARSRRRPLALGQLQSILRLPAIASSTIVARRPDHPARLREPEGAGDGRVVLELLDRRLRLPVEMRPALEHLLRLRSTRVGALPGLDEGSQVVLARRLVREGLLVVREG